MPRGSVGRIRRRPLLIVLGVVVLAAAIGVPVALWLARPAAESLPLTVVTTAPLPGQAGRFDYADVDPAAHRLFAAHMGDGVLLALDTATGAVLVTVPDLPTVTWRCGPLALLKGQLERSVTRSRRPPPPPASPRSPNRGSGQPSVNSSSEPVSASQVQ